jgi:hypothetical protein
MKYDIGTNYTIAQGLAPVSVAAGTDAGAAVDHALAPCAAFVLNTGVFGSGASVTMKLQYSDDNSSWTDDDGSSGNDYTTTVTDGTSGAIGELNVPNPLGRYSRAYITVATDAVVCGVINISGPLRRVSV